MPADAPCAPPRTLGVGFIGAGAATTAIHIPTLARLPDRFAIVHVMDVDGDAARGVASHCRCRHSNELRALLDDPEVDVVAVTSPPAFHAQHVEAAIGAGKRAVLVEKPLANTLEEARRVRSAALASRTPLVVGCMHMYDPGWLAASAAWPDQMRDTHTIRSTVLTAPHALLEGWVTEFPGRPPLPERDFDDPAVRAAMIASSVLGLAIHDLPLIRQLLPEWRSATIWSAQCLPPYGYLIHLLAGDRRVELLGHFHGHRRLEWTLDAVGTHASVHIAFTPSYVHAGPASVIRQTAGRAEHLSFPGGNGYEGEWRHLHAVACDGIPCRYGLDQVLEDLEFALQIADQASAAVREPRP